MNKHIVALASLVALSVAPTIALADQKAAMLEDVSGVSDASIAPYSEVNAGTTITLGSAGKVTFVHYATCKEVTVTGGTAVITQADYKVTGGKVSEVAQSCPERVQVASTTSVAGGLVLRGTFKPTKIQASQIVFNGANAGTLTKVVFTGEDNSTVEAKVQNRHVIVAPGSLKSGVVYDMAAMNAAEETKLSRPVLVVDNGSMTVFTVN
jgi:hypothetical protein